VLALHAVLVNFMPLQIQLQDVGGDVLMEKVEVENPNIFWGGNNLRVGMALLPDSLDVDLVFAAKQQLSGLAGRPHPEGIRIWNKFFAPLGNLEGIIIPHSWIDFISMVLMDPVRFN
jgi:hypothetical protein